MKLAKVERHLKTLEKLTAKIGKTGNLRELEKQFLKTFASETEEVSVLEKDIGEILEKKSECDNEFVEALYILAPNTGI